MRYQRLATLPVFLLVAACGPSPNSAPLAEKKAEIRAVPTKTDQTLTFAVRGADNQVGFSMQAPLEKQDGEVPASAVSGEIAIDLSDLRKSTGLINVAVDELVIYQQRAEAEGAYGEREKSDLQNEHMRDWLEIGEDAPPADAKKNKLVQFALENVEDVSTPDVGSLDGARRIVTFTAVGEFRLHQRAADKRVQMQATFEYEGGDPRSVIVETVEPVKVSLAEHDVRPRTGFGQLAEKTLDMMAPKVAKEAEVSIVLTLVPTT